MRTPKWTRETLPADGDEPEEDFETAEIGPFTIDVYRNGVWEIEGFAEGDRATTHGKTRGLPEAKWEAIRRVRRWLKRWDAQLEKLSP